MTIYYTCIERGEVKRFPGKINRKKAIAQLIKNRIKDEKTGICMSTLCGWTVHSVFFTRYRVVKQIWDSNSNGFRPIKEIKRCIKIPKSVK